MEGISEKVPSYLVRLGRQLRALRHERGLTLQDLEIRSDGEFKPSIVGAYERGERLISLSRLRRLAELYDVAVDQLLPRDRSDPGHSEQGWMTHADPDTRGRFTVDLVELERRQFPEKSVVAPYVRGITFQREDFEGTVITLRDDDVRVMAGMLSLSVYEFRRRLWESGITR